MRPEMAVAAGPTTSSRTEHEGRLDILRRRLAEERLDALLLFNQESMYYLYGYDQIGYWVYQTIVAWPDNKPPIAICRAPDEYLVRESGLIEDIRIWMDDSTETPGLLTARALGGGLRAGRARVGIERLSHGLLARYYADVVESLPDEVELVDASELVAEMRLVKSPSELEHMREAGRILEGAFDAALGALRLGVRENEVNAAVMAAMFAAGGETPAIPSPIASGPRTLSQTHAAASSRVIEAGDPVVIEIGASRRRYHAVGVTSKVLGRPSADMARLHEGLREGLEAGRGLLRPGTPTAEVARAVQAEFAKRGVARGGRHVGYGTGIGYPPTWLEPLRLKASDRHVLAPGMTLFYFAGAVDSTGSFALYIGQPIVITETAYEPLARVDWALEA